MRRPAFVEIDGKLHCWRDLVARRREQLRAYAAAEQPALLGSPHDLSKIVR